MGFLLVSKILVLRSASGVQYKIILEFYICTEVV